jgi:DNA-binding transcriptional MerR regulator
MPTTEAAPKTKAARKSWLDWVPEEGREDALLDAQPLLTRDELVVELRRGGDDINPRSLVHWQSIGVIPYPERRYYKGATRVLYPRWAVNTIHLLKSLQDQAYSLREIGPILRGNISHQFMPRARTPRQEEEQTRRAARQALFPLVEEVDPLIRSLARIHERLHGGQITRAEVRLIDDQEKGHVYPFLIGDVQDDPSREG